jgi:hypothetical protein
MVANQINRLLSVDDRKRIETIPGTSWVPEEPQEQLLPYISEEKPKNFSTIDIRREKTQEVLDKYADIITKCKDLEDEISEKCKNVSVVLNPTKHLPVIQAVQRVFGTDGLTITFQMYKTVVQELGKE